MVNFSFRLILNILGCVEDYKPKKQILKTKKFFLTLEFPNVYFHVNNNQQIIGVTLRGANWVIR
jgi:hypothetical protein